MIFYGLEEAENNNVVEIVSKTLRDCGIKVRKEDINKAFRIGKIKEKARPVLVNLLNVWKRDEILRNKKLPKHVYVTEDFSKEVLEKRRELIPQLKEERKKGRIAYLRYDKLIVKDETVETRDKRKREQSTSPKTNFGTTIPRQKVNKINAFERMYRGRAQSIPDDNRE